MASKPAPKTPPEPLPRIETLEWFVNTVMRDIVAGTDRRAWVLGAGVSKESGIPLASEFAERWARQLFGMAETGNDKQFRERLKERGWDPDKLDQHYFDIYDVNFPASSSGYAALQRAMHGKTPSYGYFILADILSNTHSNLAITVNFDNLIADALYLMGKRYPLLLDHEAVAHLATPMADVPIVCKIHRDLTKNPQSRREDMKELAVQWKPALNEIFKYYAPIFIGYGGNDHTLMDYLAGHSDGFVSPPIWLFHSPDGQVDEGDLRKKLNPDCLKLLIKTGGIVVPFSSFDLLMYWVQQRHMIATEVDTTFDARTKEIADALKSRISNLGQKWKDARSGHDPVARGLEEQTEGSSAGERSVSDWIVYASSADTPGEKVKRYEQAISLTNKTDPKLSWLYNNRGVAKSSMGCKEEAIQDYDQAVQLDPKSAMACFNRGNAKSALGQMEGGILDYDQALKLDPKDASSYANRGNAKFALGRNKEAIQDYDLAIELDPNNALAYDNRGNAKFRLGLEEEALANYDQAIRLDEKFGSPHFNKACVFALQSRADMSLPHLRRAMELDLGFCGKAKTDRDFDLIRDDPGFKALLDEMCPDKKAS